MFKKIDHIEVIPQDFQRAIDFYTGVLGFTIRNQFRVEAPPLEEVAYLDLGGTVLELMRVKSVAVASANPWQSGYRMVALEVDDMDKTVTYLAGKGVAITWGPVTLGKSKRAEIKDPDGLPIELRQW